MNIIEQLGGYYYARKMSQDWKSSIDGDIPLDTMMYSYDFGAFSWGDLQSALLEYRRQHNIFEVGDKVLFGGSPLIHEIRKFSKDSDDVYILGWGWTEIKHLKHATDEEIKAGRRLP